MPIGRQPDLRAVTGRPFATMPLPDLLAEQSVWDGIANERFYTDATRRAAVRWGDRCQLFIDAAKMRGE